MSIRLIPLVASLSLVASWGTASAQTPAPAQEVDTQAIVDALFKAGGSQANVRGSGAKGVCVKGTFTPPPRRRACRRHPTSRSPCR